MSFIWIPHIIHSLGSVLTMGTVPGATYSLPSIADSMSIWSFSSIVSNVVINLSPRTRTSNFYPLNFHFETYKYGDQQLSWYSKSSN